LRANPHNDLLSERAVTRGVSDKRCEFATDSRFLRCCDLLGERVLQVSSPRGKAISDGVGTNQAKGTSMGLELAFENERCSKQEQSYTRQKTKGSSQSAISFSLSRVDYHSAVRASASAA
jgi:hypothetical protein